MNRIIDTNDRVLWNDEWVLVTSVDEAAKTMDIKTTLGVLYYNVDWSEAADVLLPGEVKPVTDESLLAIFHKAKEAAAANVPGYTFIGAMPEAIKAGYEKHSAEYNLFVTIFLNEIPDEIVTNPETGVLL